MKIATYPPCQLLVPHRGSALWLWTILLMLLGFTASATAAAAEQDRPYRVFAYDAHKHTPIAGAEVYIYPESKLLRHWNVRGWSDFPTSPMDPQAEGALGPFLADELGWANVPTPGPGDLVVARLGDFHGFLEPRNAPEVNHLPMYSDPPIHVQALDENGEPFANQTVVLAASSWVRLNATTDENGRAQFHAPRLHLRNELNRHYSISLRAAALLPEIGPMPFADLPHEVTVHQVTGSGIRLKFELPDGSPYLGEASVKISSQRVWRSLHWSQELTPAHQGVQEIGPIALDTEVNLKFEFFGRYAYRDFDMKVKSPSAPGEIVEVTVPCPGNNLTIPFRLLAPDGSPAAGQVVSLSLMEGGKDGCLWSKEKTVTDKDGRGVATMRIDEASFAEAEDVVIYAQATLPNMRAWSEGETSIQDVLHNEAIPEVEVRITHRPLLAGGIVQDENGDSLQGATVFLVAEKRKDNPYDFSSGPRTDRGGRFTLRTRIPKEKSMVTARWQGNYPEAQPYVQGSKEHVITFPTAPNVLKGTIHLPDYVRNPPTLTFTNGEETLVLENLRGRENVPFRLFAQSDLPGTLTLTDFSVGVLATFENVQPVAKGETGDSRLGNWDLRNALPLAEVEVRIGDKNIEEFTIHPLTHPYGGAFADSLMLRTEWGHRYILPAGDQTIAILRGPKIQPMQVRLKPGHQIIDAAPGFRGEFHIEAKQALPKGTWYKIYLKPVTPHTSFLEDDVRIILNSGEVGEHIFEEREQWEIYLSLTNKYFYDGCNMINRSLPLDITLGAAGPYILDIPDDKSSFSITLKVDEDQLADHLLTMSYYKD